MRAAADPGLVIPTLGRPQPTPNCPGLGGWNANHTRSCWSPGRASSGRSISPDRVARRSRNPGERRTNHRVARGPRRAWPGLIDLGAMTPESQYREGPFPINCLVFSQRVESARLPTRQLRQDVYTWGRVKPVVDASEAAETGRPGVSIARVSPGTFLLTTISRPACRRESDPFRALLRLRAGSR